MFVLGMEGGVCTGKTTLSKQLSKLIPNAVILPEYMDLAPLSVTRLSQLSVRQRVDHFLRLEVQRSIMLDGKQPAGVVVLDRTFWSICAYEYANFKLGIENGFLGIPSVMVPFRNALIMPDVVVHLRIDSKTRGVRAEGRGRALLGILMNEDFNLYVDQFFYTCAIYMKCVEIDSASEKIDDIAAEVLKLVASHDNVVTRQEPDIVALWRDLTI